MLEDSPTLCLPLRREQTLFESKITTCPVGCPTGFKKKLFSFFRHFPSRVLCGYHCIRN
jgi:hypothetical protein